MSNCRQPVPGAIGLKIIPLLVLARVLEGYLAII